MANVEFRQAIGQVELCIEYLHEAGQSFQCAKAVAVILDNIIKEELGELKAKDSSRGDAATSNDLDSTVVPAFAVPTSTDIGNMNHLSSFGVQSSATYVQFPVQPQNALSWHQWRPGDPTRHPMEGIMPFPCAQQMAQPNLGASAPASFYPSNSFGMGLGMRGGETLSSRPFAPTQYHPDRQHQHLTSNLHFDSPFLGLQQENPPGGVMGFPV